MDMKLRWMLFLSVVSTFAYADISPQQADSFLLINPPKKIAENPVPKSPAVERLLEPMFSPDLSIRYGRGYTHYLNMLKLAEKGDAHAAYNAALYMLVNREKFNFDYTRILMLLKVAKDAGHIEAKHTLALMYLNQNSEIAKLINQPDTDNKLSKKNLEQIQQVVQKDSERLHHLSQQFILELASAGHEKAFLSACSLYVTGSYLPKDPVRAAMCYNHAMTTFKSPIAKGLLVQLYFNDKNFNSLDFEKKGVRLAQEAVLEGNVRAMAVLGYQLIYPKHLPYADVDAGVALLTSAAAQGDDFAQNIMRQNFDGNGNLLMRPYKPVKKWVQF